MRFLSNYYYQRLFTLDTHSTQYSQILQMQFFCRPIVYPARRLKERNAGKSLRSELLQIFFLAVFLQVLDHILHLLRLVSLADH
jgi:hypothetical protein